MKPIYWSSRDIYAYFFGTKKPPVSDVINTLREIINFLFITENNNTGTQNVPGEEPFKEPNDDFLLQNA